MEITISLIGLFYCVTSYIAGKAIFQSIFIDAALQAIDPSGANNKDANSTQLRSTKLKTHPVQWGSIW
jgi:hypothetical protein